MIALIYHVGPILFVGIGGIVLMLLVAHITETC